MDAKQLAIVQTVARAGDFSANLRSLVQGVRFCLDAGARLVVAPAGALDGALPGSLRARASFLLQSRAALRALADELSIPLLLACHTGEPSAPGIAPQLFLLHRGQVKSLPHRRAVTVAGLRVKADTSRELRPMSAGTADVLLHLPSGPWAQEDTTLPFARRAAAVSGLPCLVLRSVVYSHGYLAGGGSAVALPGGKTFCLPPFEQAFLPRLPRTVSRSLRPLDTPGLLLRAICFALREAVSQGGFCGVALNAESPRAELLSALACLALGARSVFLLRPEATNHCRSVPARQLLHVSLSQNCSPRVRAAVLHDLAQEHNLLLLSTASREEHLCEEPQPGLLAPLADLYESELAALRAALIAASPEQRPCDAQPTCPSPRELALRLLIDANRCPADIATSTDLDETLLRSLMRRIDRTAALRPSHSSPQILHLRRDRPIPPPHQRLME